MPTGFHAESFAYAARGPTTCANIDVDLPRNRLIVITGLSGSGKSSLAFDTLYAEGQRRYVESLSAYARQFLSMMDKPDVDSIEGLSPAIAIEQKATSHNPRSTVGTVTEIYDYLRLLYARAGIPRCPTHGIDLVAQTVSQMVDQVLKLPEGESAMLLAPLVSARKGEHFEVMHDLMAQGFVRARVDGRVIELDAVPKLDPRKKHDIEAVVDRFRLRPDIAPRLAESFETALRLSNGLARLAFADNSGREEQTFSSRHACPVCGHSVPPLEPKLFSFNNPSGACPSCDGLGFQEFFDPARVVVHPELSLAGGAIRGWDRRNAYYFHMIMALAAALPLRRRGAVAGAARRRPASASSKAAARRRSSSATPMRAAAWRSASTPSKASCRTWSGAIARPSPARCARSWRNSAAAACARAATAAG